MLARWTGRAEGNLRPGDGAETRWLRVVDRPWSWVRQVHGADVVTVARPGASAGEPGDALVTAEPGTCLAVFAADCAPVALASPEGMVGVAHAGWRGLVAGVIGQTVEAMRRLGATRVVAGLGPCIHPDCYEFRSEDLDRVAATLGDVVWARTSTGRPALDLPAGVRSELAAAGAELVVDLGRCTACSPDLFSYRGGDDGHQAVVAWRP